MDTFWAPFLIYVFVSAFTPGPNNLLALANAGTFGLHASIPLLLGLATSFLILMSVCGLAATLLSEFLPTIIPPLTVIGTLYIFYLAWQLVRSGYIEKNDNVHVCGFWNAFILQFVNVKVILYGITSFTTFILPHTQDRMELFWFAVLLAASGHAANWTWALAGNTLRPLFDRYGKIINPFLAFLLISSTLQLVAII